MTLEPVSVALKFGFVAVLFLFVLWVARSARQDLRGGAPFAKDRGPGAQAGQAGRRGQLSGRLSPPRADSPHPGPS